MSEADAVPLVVQELSRAVLDGVKDGDEVQRADLGLLPVFSDERPLLGLGGFVDWRSCGRLSGLLRSGLCTGALGERVLLPGRSTLPVDRIVLFGLGESHSFDRARAIDVGGALVELARDMSARRVMLAIPSALTQRDVTEALFAAVAEHLAVARPEPEPEPEAQPESEPEPEAAPPQAEAEPEPETTPAPAPALFAAPAPAPAEPEPQAPEDDAAPAEPAAAEPAPVEPPPAQVVVRAPAAARPREQWWAVAEARLVQRLRRLLSGPPRAAADEGT